MNQVFLPLLLLITVNLVFLDIAIFSRKITIATQSETVTIAQPSPSPALEATDTPEPTQTVVYVSQDSKPKEYQIQLGSATTVKDSWEDFIGIEAEIDTKNYPGITRATFEVFTNIPTANGSVHAKLINVTDKHDVWFSEVTSQGNAVTRHEVPITLDVGKKTYRLSGKTSLRYEANITNARIKIFTQ